MKKLNSKHFYVVFLALMTIVMPLFMSFFVTLSNLNGFAENFFSKWMMGYLYDMMLAIPASSFCGYLTKKGMDFGWYSEKRYTFMYILIMCTFMSFVVSAIITTMNFGFSLANTSKWLQASVIAFVTAFPASFVAASVITKFIYKYLVQKP